MLEQGEVIGGRFRLETRIGRGGMGTVWAATHMVTKARVAIKVLSRAMSEDDGMRKRFLSEARAAAAVEHPNVISVLDIFEHDDHSPVMVLELLEGETLGSVIKRREVLTLEQTATVMAPVVSAVAAAHALGIVHRDLKPENVFLANTDEDRVRPKVLDFGIAKLLDPTLEDKGLTGTGMTLGTPCYMAPEQGFGEKDIDHRVDIWALGVIIYLCLSGMRPIEAENLGQFLKLLMTTAIMPLSELEPELPKDITTLVMRMLSRERAERPSLAEVLESLSPHAKVDTLAAPDPFDTGRIDREVLDAVAAQAERLQPEPTRDPTRGEPTRPDRPGAEPTRPDRPEAAQTHHSLAGQSAQSPRVSKPPAARKARPLVLGLVAAALTAAVLVGVSQLSNEASQAASVATGLGSVARAIPSASATEQATTSSAANAASTPTATTATAATTTAPASKTRRLPTKVAGGSRPAAPSASVASPTTTKPGASSNITPGGLYVGPIDQP